MEKEEFDNDKYMNMELLRFTTAGSVDDGKSTLIGRLLYDSKSIFEDQYEAIAKSSRAKGEENVNLALITDGLKDEMEQGITIDVAYRYFATPKRKFIIADTPGHIEYTRNMVTGASTANLAILLVDARHGVVEQTCRHAFIATLLKIPHVVICINKMDLVDYSQEVYDKIRADFKKFSSKLEVADIRFIPISALKGDNVVNRSENMPWFDGPTLMYQLENVHIASDRNYVDCRFPVQNVIRPMSDEHHDFRGYGGRVAGGVFKPGDKVTVLPTGLTSTIKTIELFDKKLEKAYPPMSVTMTLEDDINLSRGDMIVRGDNQPEVTQDIEMMVCWMDDKPLQLNGLYAIKHTTREARCKIVDIKYKVDVNTLSRLEEENNVGKNDIARITIRSTQPLYIDKYRRNRNTGSIILIDEGTNNTVGAGMII
ncbi:MAG: GTP-binding protein [Flavobacteriales bacterium]|nr:GTP-binding protein [Flavobacteriales bacterium]